MKEPSVDLLMLGNYRASFEIASSKVWAAEAKALACVGVSLSGFHL